MVNLKTPEEIKAMHKGGVILHKVLLQLLDKAEPGVTLAQLDDLALKLIRQFGAQPSFKRVPGYKWTICACVNDVVVHGIPNDYSMREGDVVGIDCGVYLGGFHTDHAWTKRIQNSEFRIQNKQDETDRFLSVGEKALGKAIKQVQPGNYIYDISKAIQDTVESAGYSVVRSLIGHGVGRKLHEDPEVPGFISSAREQSLKLVQGMVLAIEVIYNLGSPDVVYKGNDGWTIATKDGKISGLFERTVAITPRGGFVLT